MEILNNSQHPYPRLCAHRGAHKGVAPENSMISYQRALELGADEIEIDLWPSKEGEMFAFHDATVKKITGTPTYISDLTSKEIRALDMGVGFAPEFKGMQIPTFEEVLDLVARRVIINIHIKTPVKNRMITPTLRSRFDHWKVLYASPEALMPPFPDCEGEIDWEYENRPMARYDERDFRTILDLLDKYKCREHVYIAGERDVLCVAREMAPDIARCCLEAKNYRLVDIALEYECQKVQFDKEMTTKAMFEKAKANNLRCNLFWSNHPEEACAYYDYGMDCILTDDFENMNRAVKAHFAGKNK